MEAEIERLREAFQQLADQRNLARFGWAAHDFAQTVLTPNVRHERQKTVPRFLSAR